MSAWNVAKKGRKKKKLSPEDETKLNKT